MIKYRLLNYSFLFFLLLGSLPYPAACISLAYGQTTDSLPAHAKVYQGLRIHLHDLQLTKQTGDFIKVSFVPINTGREDLRFGEVHLPHLSNLIVEFDESFSESELATLQNDIETTILYQDLTVLAGNINPRKEMKINTKMPVLSNELLTEKGVQKESPKKEKKKKKNEDSFSINIGGDDEPIVKFDKNTCPDLRIDTLVVLQESKKSVTLQYTISNQGKGPANMIGLKKGSADNVAIKAHMSSSPRLHRGAIVIGGGFIDDLPREKQGVLLPNEKHTGTIKLDLRKMTRFTPVVILELDTYQSVRECDERNNNNHVELNRGQE